MYGKGSYRDEAVGELIGREGEAVGGGPDKEGDCKLRVWGIAAIE